MICGSCGTQNPEKYKFCQSCGTLLDLNNPNPKFARPPEEYQGPKKLYRSRENRMIAGVCGGLGEHLGIDPTIIRLLWIIFIFMGMGIVAYIIAIVIIPESPYGPWSEPKH